MWLDFSGDVKIENGELGDLSLQMVLKTMGLDKILNALTFTFLLSTCRKIGSGTLSNSY